MSKRGLSARHSVPNQTLSLVNFRLPKGNPTAGNRGRPGGYGGSGSGFHALGGGGRLVTSPFETAALRPPLKCRMGGAKRYPSMPVRVAMGIASLHPSYADTTSRSRGAFRPRFSSNFVPLKTEGAGKTGCSPHPRSRVPMHTAKAHTSIQVRRKHSGLPCAMALRLTSSSPR